MKKIRFGVVGTGNIVSKVIEAARLDARFELTAVYSRTQGRADVFATQHRIPHTFTNLQAMVSSDLIDAVYIASPNSCHCQQSILAIEHGKHVLCEKPLASNAKEARIMIEVAKKHEVLLMEAMKTTLEPNFDALRRAMQEIGAIRHYSASYCQYSSRYDNFKRGIIENAFKPELSNGATVDIGIYTIYPMVVLFGKPTEIQALGTVLHTGVDGQAVVNFKFDNGMTASVCYSKLSDSYLPSEIQGEQACIVCQKINFFDNIKMIDDSGEHVISEVQQNTYFYEIQEFINLIEKGEIESAINSHSNSLICMEIIDEIRKQLGVVYPADNCSLSGVCL